MSAITLKGENFFLRALEPEDIGFLYQIENDENIWHVSQTRTPYSKFVLKQYLENAGQDIYEAKQLRLAICANDSKLIGLIDLFDFDPANRRAGIGIVVAESSRGSGVGSEALELLLNYSFSRLALHQVYANIDPQNHVSVALFTKFGFEKTGTKKDWNLVGGNFTDEDMYQLIHHPK